MTNYKTSIADLEIVGLQLFDRFQEIAAEVVPNVAWHEQPFSVRGRICMLFAMVRNRTSDPPIDQKIDDIIERAIGIVEGWRTNTATALSVIDRDIEGALADAGGHADHTAVREMAAAVGLMIIKERIDR